MYFTPVNGSVNQYHVIYGHSQGDARFGLLGANINEKSQTGVQAITINYLDPKGTYWFEVAPVNGCAVGMWSNWLESKSSRVSSFRW